MRAKRTLAEFEHLGDGIATMISGSGGGTGVTTYAENMGVMAVTRIYSTLVFVVAAAIAILLGFSPKFGALGSNSFVVSSSTKPMMWPATGASVKRKKLTPAFEPGRRLTSFESQSGRRWPAYVPGAPGMNSTHATRSVLAWAAT